MASPMLNRARMALWVVASAITQQAGAAVCVVSSGGVLQVADTETAPACSQFLLQQAGDMTVTDVFNVPVTADLQQVWMLFFALPMIIYLSAWALGQVVSFINPK